jgi:hypothetical protein
MGSTSVDSNKPSSVGDISSAQPQWQQKLCDGTNVLIRPIHEADENLETAIHRAVIRSPAASASWAPSRAQARNCFGSLFIRNSCAA